MLPAFAFSNVADNGSAYTKFMVEIAPVAVSNIAHVTLSKFGAAIALTFIIAAIFCRHVAHIIGVGSKKKMIGIYARRVVAFVQYMKFFRDRTVCKGPHKSMNKPLFIRSGNSPVPFSGFRSLPFPTIFIGCFAPKLYVFGHSAQRYGFHTVSPFVTPISQCEHKG